MDGGIVSVDEMEKGNAAKIQTTVTMRDVHERLRRLILDGEFPPGSEVSQIALADRLECSRTPLREALRLLESEGLVVSEGAYRLIRIGELSMVDLDDLYASRALGEGLAIWLTVPTLRSKDFEELNQDLEATSAGDLDAHRRFHRRLRGGAGPRLEDQLERLFEHAERYQREYRDQALDLADAFQHKSSEHQAILDACVSGDRSLARALLVDHIADTADQLMAAMRHAPYSLTEAVRMAKAGYELPAVES
jgi:DNA-binding GntR family transcriptional regulator